MSDQKIHTFENGVSVYDYHILDIQRKRYAKKNVHEEEEEEVFLEAIRNIPPNGVFASIGTAIGYYPLLARKIRSDIKIQCFEPLPRHIIYFKENIQLNKMDPAGFSIHPEAVSTSFGEVSFKDNSYGSAITTGNSDLSLKRQIKRFIKSLIGRGPKHSIITVKSIPMLDIFKMSNTDILDFVQMDIQGFEQPVLEKYFADLNSDANEIKTFLIGTHGLSIHQACIKLFKENGYEILIDEHDTKHQPDGIIYCTKI
jgi:FkbM family methyltransferase